MLTRNVPPHTSKAADVPGAYAADTEAGPPRDRNALALAIELELCCTTGTAAADIEQRSDDHQISSSDFRSICSGLAAA